jgi:hypothetical protein
VLGLSEGHVEIDLEGVRVKAWRVRGSAGGKSLEIVIEWVDSEEVSSRGRKDRVGVKVVGQRVRTRGGKVIKEGYYMQKEVPK